MSHRFSVEVEAQESDSFLGTDGSIGTEQRITYYGTYYQNLKAKNHELRTELIILF
jgi:hypothetical protein